MLRDLDRLPNCFEAGSRVSDFVAYEPSAHSVTSEATVRIRAAKPVDAHGLAAVMSSRGGTVEDHLDAAAGLTVVPDQRRQGIALRLLRAVLRVTADTAPGESTFSVINARNPASIDLHTGLGFVEVARAATFAGIDFTGGEGVLLRRP